MEWWVQCWAPQYETDRGILEQVQRGAKMVVKGLEHLSYKERLKELELCRLEKRRLRATFSICINTCWERAKERGPDSSQWCPVTGQEAMVVKHRHRLPKEIMESPSVKIFNIHWDAALNKVPALLCCMGRLWGDLIAAFQFLKGAYKKDGDRHFSRACCDRTRGNGFKLKDGRFRLDIRKKFFTMRVVKHWNRFPREVVGAPSLETL
ncbi:hypothetical protein QYF61_017987, partial [Mycteria americana]